MTKHPYFHLYIFLFSLFTLLLPTNQAISPLPSSVVANLASREMRYHHLLFHNVRNLWNRLDSNTQARIESYGWRPPRPSKDSNGKALIENNSGEDFLYMHRNMIAIVNNLMAQAGAENVTSFSILPNATDSDLPMPPIYTGPTSQITRLIRYYKSENWYSYLKSQETKLKDPDYLRSVTLGELGAYIEWTSDIHQGMHFRFSSYNNLMRPITSRVIPYIDRKWDVTSSDWLGDLYSSQVNPWFWKLHGWIDDRINDWQAANNISSITWKGTWTGGLTGNLPSNLNIPDNPNVRVLSGDHQHMDMDMDMDMGSGHTGMNLTAMEEVAKILIEKGIQCEYYSDLDPENNPVTGHKDPTLRGGW